MSFSIAPKGAAAPVVDNTASHQKAQEARQRAISILTNSKPQEAAPPAPEDVLASQTLKSEGHQDPVEASTPAPEAPEEPAPEAPAKKEEPLSQQYAVLARKERQLRAKAQQQEQAFKQREEALRQRESEYAKKEAEYGQNFVAKDRLKQDLLGVAEELGISYDEITQAAMTQSSLDPNVRRLVSQMEAKIAKLEAEAAKTQKSFTDSQADNYKQAVKQIEMDTRALVRNNPEFETIKATNSVMDVVELIEKTFNQDGILLTVEEAALAVEEELVNEATKIASLSKIQRKLKPATAPAPKAPDANSKKPNEMKTLTNAVGSSQKLSARDRAILAFSGKLK